MLFDRSPRLTFFADKVAVRDYVRDRLSGTEHLTTLYAVIGEAAEVRDLELPAQFVMKPNHLSHAVKLVRGGAFDRAEFEALAASWFQRNYFYELGEWAYRDIKPRVLFEELLDPDGETPVDYKFHCFDGEPRFLSLISGRFGRLTLDLYDMDFRPVPARFEDLPVSVPQATVPPPNFVQMLEIARRLSAGVGYVRVDLYNIAGRIVFGELTNYPGAGLLKFDPPVWDRIYGDFWRVQ
ncbi:MAG: ATP-grasp fold amidoligase family protein [Candidatus Limnocylindria bacterium]